METMATKLTTSHDTADQRSHKKRTSSWWTQAVLQKAL
jgi:hypothetical protein